MPPARCTAALPSFAHSCTDFFAVGQAEHRVRTSGAWIKQIFCQRTTRGQASLSMRMQHPRGFL